MGTRHSVTAALVVLLATAACTSDKQVTGASTTVVTTTVATTVETTVDPGTTAAPDTAPPTSDTTAPTPAPTTVAAVPTVAVTPTTSGGAGCDGASGIPAAATQMRAILGDIDGDTQPDTVTSYSLDGIPHVHAQLASGGQSDTEVPIGFADTVDISFEDIDHALGAATPPPVAVMAIGPTKAGTALAGFLTLTKQYCIRLWHDDNDNVFTVRIAADGPYQGLLCDGAAGSIHYSMMTAEQNAGGDWTVTQQEFKHNFTKVVLLPPTAFTVPDGPDIQANYGDIVNCGHPPLFP